MKIIKTRISLIIYIIICLFLFVSCTNEKDDDKNLNPYGPDLGKVINDGRTFVCNLSYDLDSNNKWINSISLDKVVTQIEEDYNAYDDSMEACGNYISKFEADVELTKSRRVVLSFQYNDDEKSIKHPKIYDFKLFVDYDGSIEIEDIIERNMYGVDENEHVWVHYDSQRMTCKQDGWTEYDECSICGERRGYEFIPMVGGEHNYVASSDSPYPSKEKPAHAERTCTKCGDVIGDYANALNRGEEGMQNLNILLIGNSYTNYNTMMNCLKGVIEGEGIKVNIVKVSYGSQYLYDYIEGPQGDYYNKVEEAVNKTKFDIVFLQDQSTNPVDNQANFFDSTRTLYEYFTKLGTTCIMYETWTRKGGYKGWSEKEMTQRMSAAYSAIAKELGISVSHCGTACYYLMTRMPSLPSHNSDNSHPSTFTSYLVALCHYATVYGRSPIGINYTYNDYIKDSSITWHATNERTEISDEVQRQLEQIAYDAVFGPSIVTSQYAISSIGVTEKK